MSGQMKIIVPVPMTDGRLVSSNVPEDDHAEYSAATTYAAGARCILTTEGTHRIYESLAAANTGHYPPDYLVPVTVGEAQVTWWKDVGATNRWKMFDAKSMAASVQEEIVEVEIRPGKLFNAIAMVGLSANEVQVTVTDATDGKVYDKLFDLYDNTNVFTVYDWFFAPRIMRDTAIGLDLPNYLNGVIKITARSFVPGVEVRVGEIVVGRHLDLGVLKYGFANQLDDYSTKERDDEGNVSLIPGQYSTPLSCELRLERVYVPYIKKVLGSLRATPLIFVGQETMEETIVYGWIENFDFSNINERTTSLSLDIQELS